MQYAPPEKAEPSRLMGAAIDACVCNRDKHHSLSLRLNNELLIKKNWSSHRQPNRLA